MEVSTGVGEVLKLAVILRSILSLSKDAQCPLACGVRSCDGTIVQHRGCWAVLEGEMRMSPAQLLCKLCLRNPPPPTTACHCDGGNGHERSTLCSSRIHGTTRTDARPLAVPRCYPRGSRVPSQ